jgi:hypothetical protein
MPHAEGMSPMHPDFRLSFKPILVFHLLPQWETHVPCVENILL